MKDTPIAPDPDIAQADVSDPAPTDSTPSEPAAPTGPQAVGEPAPNHQPDSGSAPAVPTPASDSTIASTPLRSPDISEEELNRLLAEAEHRGWLRARNELAAQAMESTDMLGNPAINRPSTQPESRGDDFASRFLRTLTPDVWQ